MIEKIEISNFLGLAEATYGFGPGLNIITGPNGSGKSTIMEAITWAIWGKGARAKLEVGAKVSIHFNKEVLIRSINKSGEVVNFRGTITSKTKVAGEIAKVFGNYEAWLPSLRMSGETANRFFSMTTGEKWEYLAKTVGATDYYEAAEYARSESYRYKLDADAAENSMNDHSYYSDMSQARSRLGKERIEDKIIEDSETGVTTEDVAAAKGDFVHKCSIINKKIRALVAEKIRTTEHAANLAVKLASTQPAICGECKQEINDEILTIKEQIQQTRLNEEQLQNSIDRLETDKVKLEQQYRAVEHQANVESQYKREISYFLERINDVECSVIKNIIRYYTGYANKQLAVAKHKEAKKLSEACKKSEAALIAAGDTLISKVLESLFATTNYYLESINSPLRISLGQSKASSRAIVVSTNTAGGVYESCSSGERRRIDVCTMIALSMISADLGRLPPMAPVIIDEAFDTLDEVGTSALLELANKLAQTRQVFIVSHTIPQMETIVSSKTIFLG